MHGTNAIIKIPWLPFKYEITPKSEEHLGDKPRCRKQFIFLCKRRTPIMFSNFTCLTLLGVSSESSLRSVAWWHRNKDPLIDEWKTNFMSLAILFHLLCAQHVSDINISIFRSLRLCWWITTSVVLFSVLVCWSFCCGCYLVVFVLQALAHNTQRNENKTTDVVINQHSRKLLKMDILMSETCWAHNKWNKIASDIKLVFHSSNIAMMHGPINIRRIH